MYVETKVPIIVDAVIASTVIVIMLLVEVMSLVPPRPRNVKILTLDY